MGLTIKRHPPFVNRHSSNSGEMVCLAYLVCLVYLVTRIRIYEARYTPSAFSSLQYQRVRKWMRTVSSPSTGSSPFS